jgi:hypothetical protein
MARSRPEPDPIPRDGGSYLLDPGTGKWVNQEMPPVPAPVITEPVELPTDATVHP